MARHLRLAFAIWVGLATFVAGNRVQAQNAEIALAESEFHERLDERGRVSGDIVMGVMIGPALEGDAGGAMMADVAPRTTANVAVLRLPERMPRVDARGGEARLFCVRINSKDGRFEAENTYSVDAGVPGQGGTFVYNGRHAPVLKAMRAVSLVKVGRCGDRTEEILPSMWGGTAMTPGSGALHIFVNSAGNPTYAVVGSDPDYVTCEDVSDASTLKYTASCILPFKTLEAHRRNDRIPLTFYVTRSLGEESFEITIVLPHGGN